MIFIFRRRVEGCKAEKLNFRINYMCVNIPMKDGAAKKISYLQFQPTMTPT